MIEIYALHVTLCYIILYIANNADLASLHVTVERTNTIIWDGSI